MLSLCASCCTPHPAAPGPDALSGTLPLAGIPPPTPTSRSTPDLDWSEEELVYLHWRLLQDVAQLADPHRDPLPFSFATCLRVVGSSPLSPIGYCGAVDVEEVREQLRVRLRRWFELALDAYPAWVRQLVREQPVWIEAQLDKNPQWLNEQLKVMAQQGDLFR